ncbi:MAG TPA: ABC transporter ATP-binding protein [Propioniciclava sp.]|jgi:ABC-type multidrug transport system fused ATPase/permease subunit|uniref:ABC transporter ATP-binding protein n=1 Tax=Propioniciclava sp. TaxID=2038686 RepID=UPI002BA2C8A9|nr:ABC transporter ATP-binding protein [Propioniciclava sp.]HRL49374.1 ABC transporter ATP-binding protein [Propioniciclava sp.]HRL80870.1 ABC transporter ATP-binding protein [Propioniciclava sp.]
MRDFPPEVLPGDTPTWRSPLSFLTWLVRGQAGLVTLMTVLVVVWQLPSVLSPLLLGRAIDAGMIARDPLATAGWSALLLLAIVIGAAGGILQHTYVVRSWVIAIYETQKRVGHTSGRLGHVLGRRVPTGEVLSVASSDSDTFGATLEVAARFIGAVLSFVFVCVLMFVASPQLALVVIILSPLLMVASAPVLRPLSAAQRAERTQNSELTSLATDIVAGLRILRGIGGEATFGANYAAQSQKVRFLGVRVGTWQSVVAAISVLVSGVLLVTLVYLGTHELSAGHLTVGQLISFVGYALYMLWPLQTFFDFAQKWIAGLVAAAKTSALLGAQTPWRAGGSPVGPSPRLVDDVSGVVVEPGRFLAVVSADPDASAALVDRLGRYLPSLAGATGEEDAEDGLRGRALRQARSDKAARRAAQAQRDEEAAQLPWGVTADGVDLRDVDLTSLRERVLVSDTSSMLFAGTLQQAIDPWGRATREQAERALVTASAEDVFDALPGGWQGPIDEKGRGLSGGQRQRLILARALLADADVLCLVEPTSAVDAHTEARIAPRLAEFRRGKTTVVTSASPLILHAADEVSFLADGVEVARGTHTALLTRPDYRRVVARGMEEDDD